MLILRRKAGEAIWIGDNIKVTILANDEGGVRLAVDAPKEITILREELLNAIRANKDAAEEQAAPEALLAALPGRKQQPAEKQTADETGKQA